MTDRNLVDALDDLASSKHDDHSVAAEAADEIRRLRAILEAALPLCERGAETGWLTMESAPKDGTKILVCWDAPTSAYQAIGVVFFDHSESYNGWLSFPGYWYKEPTRWRPLPPPPTDGGVK